MEESSVVTMAAKDSPPATQETGGEPVSAEIALQLGIAPPQVLSGPIPLFDRHFSWLEFDRRVLAEAESPDVPLLERVKFLSIASSNLDEFFMTRVGEIRDLITAQLSHGGGLSPREQLKGIRERADRLLNLMYTCFHGELVPALRKAGIRLESIVDLSKKEQVLLREYFQHDLAPILTPLAIDPGHPFPYLSNLTLNMAVVLASPRGEEHVVLLKMPSFAPRLFRLPGTRRYVPIESIVAEHIGNFFPGLTVREAIPFRAIRNSDFALREDEVTDLLKSIEAELRSRERKEIVALEVEASADEPVLALLTGATGVSRKDVFLAPGFLRLSDLMQLYDEIRDPELRDPPFNSRIPAPIATNEDIFSIIARTDVMLHRPFDSFSPVVELVQTAAQDPAVVAIKQTLYRTDQGSPIVEALVEAARQGKEVTAVVELQARFDERKNIAWARRLEQAGVQVVYGLLGMKTHCKVCLVIRHEEEGLRRYVHLSTGNYNATTARVYTDIDFFTCDPAFGADAAQLMNLLTGFSAANLQETLEREAPALVWNRFVVAPIDYHRWVVEKIDRETQNAIEGRPAEITAQLNGLVEPLVIEALYRASQAGVKIRLVVRGTCCLVPGLPGVSENIKVLSIIDRFLEHSRIFAFGAGADAEVWVSSGDWMPRNFFRRIEVAWPVLDPSLKKTLHEEILGTLLRDNVKGWRLQADGSYRRRNSDEPVVRSQSRFIEISRSNSIAVGPYEEIIRTPGSFRRKAKKAKKKR